MQRRGFLQFLGGFLCSLPFLGRKEEDKISFTLQEKLTGNPTCGDEPIMLIETFPDNPKIGDGWIVVGPQSRCSHFIYTSSGWKEFKFISSGKGIGEYMLGGTGIFDK